MPSAFVVDENGKPLNSWRTIIADYWIYGFEDAGFSFEKSWDDDANAMSRIAKSPAPDQLRCPNSTDRFQTTYLAVVGQDTMWPTASPLIPADDGTDDDKILVIEVVNSDVLWIEPRDLTLEQAIECIEHNRGPCIGSQHRCGINYLTVGGDVRTLRHDIDRESLRRLLVREHTPNTP
ncbi:MAG: hypothetical protein NT069_14235 [Planctomycetota bacterium]|nr:hypothetical protein [Planctomycetota bacterium]